MRLRLSALALLLASSAFARVDEGMWTFDNLPLQKMKAKHGFAPDQAWLEHLRLSVVRFPGGTGSFVSKDGLVLTNHHVGRGWTQQVSGPGEKDYIKHGFVAAGREAEIKVPGAVLYTLMAMENVTDKAEAAAKGAKGDKAAAEAKTKALDAYRAELEKKTGLTCEVVTLYQGGEIWIYQYKKHTDIRLVMAPEGQMAFFGGDPDNFTYPRHDLDFTLFRVYENGKPYNPAQHLKWTSTGLKAGDLTFVAGHPGSTARLETTVQMESARDLGFPMRLKSLKGQIEALKAYGAKDEEHMRQVRSNIFGLENGQKAITGYWEGLKNAAAMKKIKDAENELKAKVAKDPKLAYAKESWTKVAALVAQQKAKANDFTFVNTRGSQTLGIGLTLVRLAEEAAKPSDKRLAEFADNRLPALKARLGAPNPAPFNAELEMANFTFGLEEAERALGANHEFVKAMLGGKKAAEVAKAAVDGTKLHDPAVRKALIEGGAKAVAESTDPMILLGRKLDPLGRKIRKAQEDLAHAIGEQTTRIAKARFAAYGKSTYPDATFSLRLTYGAVAGYKANGTDIQPFTTFHGLLDRHYGQGGQIEGGDWALPQRWLDKKGALNLPTPYNFSHKVDIIGGNSGSPVVDQKGELVGLIFDGNIESLPGRYYYDEGINRGVSVDARAIIEALDKVYEAPALVAELKGN